MEKEAMSETIWLTRIFPAAADDAIKGWSTSLPIRQTNSSEPAERPLASNPNISWRRDALVAFSLDVCDEGVASPIYDPSIHRVISSIWRVRLPPNRVSYQSLGSAGASPSMHCARINDVALSCDYAKITMFTRGQDPVR
jgi:hypothetical protein